MTPDSSSYIRPTVAAMHGYTPGEQPKMARLIKLNTNENPYPPSPAARAALTRWSAARLNRYPDPAASGVCAAAAALFGLTPDWVIAGNGSDDILTITVRTFLDAGDQAACLHPSYSLYPILTTIQDAGCRLIPLNADFSLPVDLVSQAAGCKLLLIANPNAPTGNAFPVAAIAQVCRTFPGIVLIDEAYADFAATTCASLLAAHDNLIISRTLSKGYALAGLRLGYAVARPPLIEAMVKVKDSYNVSALTQVVGEAALRDQAWLKLTTGTIIATRQRVAAMLELMHFTINPSATNFLFVRPPIPAADYFHALRNQGIVVRYFPGPVTGDWVRITMGTDPEMNEFLTATRLILSGRPAADRG